MTLLMLLAAIIFIITHHVYSNSTFRTRAAADDLQVVRAAYQSHLKRIVIPVQIENRVVLDGTLTYQPKITNFTWSPVESTLSLQNEITSFCRMHIIGDGFCAILRNQAMNISAQGRFRNPKPFFSQQTNDDAIIACNASFTGVVNFFHGEARSAMDASTVVPFTEIGLQGKKAKGSIQSIIDTGSVCSLREILRLGHWVYPTNGCFIQPNAKYSCPNFGELVHGHRHADALIFSAANYGCGRGRNAYFELLPRVYDDSKVGANATCTLFSLLDALHELFRRNFFANNGKIVYVGDCLMVQYYLSMICAASRIERDNYVGDEVDVDVDIEGNGMVRGLTTLIAGRIELQTEVSFLTDFPCHSRCLEDALFRGQNALTLCKKCADGVLQSNNSDHTDARHWFAKLDSDAKAVVLNSGSWFSARHGMDVALIYDLYEKMLSYIAPILRSFVEKKMTVIWIALPPFEANNDMDPHSNYDTYAIKNAMAREVLEPIGVHILDANRLISNRLRLDASTMADSGHYCSPHDSSIPDFLNRLIVHIILENNPSIDA
jgi:hypothetical protein